jgi:hypothetical protein
VFGRVEAGRRRLRFDADVAAAGRLLVPLASYPGVEVRVDGDRVRVEPTLAGTLSFDVEEGRHEVVVTGPSGPRRATGRTVTLFGIPALALLFAISVLVERRRRRAGQPA